MSQNFSVQPPDVSVSNQFQQELDSVEERLTLAFKDLYMPLSGLVRAQIQQARPHLRAGVVLAVAIQPNEDPRLREKRVYLASALEMLYIALNLHQLLLENNGSIDDTIDKSILGSTILAGDYCFSHAASLAAHTDSPQVVAIFAQTLQNISEQQLRAQFSDSLNNSSDSAPSPNSFHASPYLFQAGLAAANALVEFDSQTLLAHQKTIDNLSAQLLHNKSSFLLPQSAHTDIYQRRWAAFIEWVNQNS